MIMLSYLREQEADVELRGEADALQVAGRERVNDLNEGPDCRLDFCQSCQGHEEQVTISDNR